MTEITDRYGRTLCCREKCPAFFSNDTEPFCDINQLYFSKTDLLCKITKKYKVIKR